MDINFSEMNYPKTARSWRQYFVVVFIFLIGLGIGCWYFIFKQGTQAPTNSDSQSNIDPESGLPKDVLKSFTVENTTPTDENAPVFDASSTEYSAFTVQKEASTTSEPTALPQEVLDSFTVKPK